MSDRYGQFSGGDTDMLHLKNKKPCRVAYTLDNKQPVSSTFIGEQPLFYMDIQEGCEDDLYLDSEFGEEIESLEKEMKALERFSGSFEDHGEKLFQELLENSADIVTAKDSALDEDHSFLVTRLCKTIKESRMGGALLELMNVYKVTLKCSQHVEYAAYDRRNGAILINPNCGYETLVLLTIRELRRHWQHRQGALINPLTFQPDAAVLVNRAQVADLAVGMIRAAWELQLSGHKEIWERIERSTLSDLGHAFAREAFLDFRTINNGVACAAVFESWFLSERCQGQDRALIQIMLADHQGYVFDIDTVSAGLTPELIGALGSMPFGKNYLAQHAGTILSDPIFTDVRDRSNANFLWFIKFERSFRETERTLQNSPDKSSAGVLPGGLQKKGHDANHEQQSAQIIPLATSTGFRGDSKESDNAKKSDKILAQQESYQQDSSSQSDNVVYLGRWSAE